jgi:hypothetical protein
VPRLCSKLVFKKLKADLTYRLTDFGPDDRPTTRRRDWQPPGGEWQGVGNRAD